MLSNIFRPTKLKLVLVAFIFAIFTATFFYYLSHPLLKKSSLPTSIKKMTFIDGVNIASIILYLPIAAISKKLGSSIPDYGMSVEASAILTALQYSFIYYILLSLLFYLLSKWFKSSDTPRQAEPHSQEK